MCCTQAFHCNKKGHTVKAAADGLRIVDYIAQKHSLAVRERTRSNLRRTAWSRA